MLFGWKTMETNDSNSHSHEYQPSNDVSKEISTERVVFLNHAVIAWHEMRRQWVGDRSQKSKRAPREPIMSWSTTYEDLLCSSDPFQQPIALAEMVDFLVGIWHEEGLYD